MKILVIQLARLGDIVQSWPTLSALSRNYPEADIHCLVREKFATATVGLSSAIRIHELKTAQILAPMMRNTDDRNVSSSRFDEFLNGLQAEKFDKIINLSFSPFSSYLTHFLQPESKNVCGYTRHKDGYLHIPDDTSAYFYGQVGLQKWNRYHLIDIFAAVAGVDLEAEDWKVSGPLPLFEKSLPSEYLVVHLGASESHKSWSIEHWNVFLHDYCRTQSTPIILVGQKGEEHGLEDTISEYSNKIVSLVGKTRISDLFSIVKYSKLAIGGDSLIMQVATMTSTPALNLSCQSVKFWETGPRSLGSQVVWEPNIQDISPERVLKVVTQMLEGSPPESSLIRVVGSFGRTEYCWDSAEAGQFEWDLIQALYTGEALPVLEDPDSFHALVRVRDLCQVGIEAIGELKQEQTREQLDRFLQTLDSVDTGFNSVGSLNATSEVLVSWYRTEKIRLEPAGINSLKNKTQHLLESLKGICQCYVGEIHKIPTLGGENGNQELES